MSTISRFRNAFRAFRNDATISLSDSDLLHWLGISSENTELNEVTYYTCLKMLSEAMGKIPLKFYQDTENGRIRAKPNQSAELLMNRPNPAMTPSTFWSTIEANRNHFGNAFVWRQGKFKRKKYGGDYEVIAFWPMQSECVDVVMDDAGIFANKGRLYYKYNDPRTGELYVFDQDDVMHFKTWCTFDGIMGKPVKDILKDLIGAQNAAQDYLNNLYKSGMTQPMSLQYTSDLDDARRKKLQEHYEKMASGPKNAGRVIPVPMGMTLQPLNIKLADSQFAELKKYSALQIAAAFGVKPNQLNDYSKSSYANSEAQQLSFLVDTMLYILTAYEQEINYKCLTTKERTDGLLFKFNEKAILRTDSKTQMEILQMSVGSGIRQVNEARRLLDESDVEGGDVNLINGTYVPLTMIGAAYGGGGETDGTD